MTRVAVQGAYALAVSEVHILMRLSLAHDMSFLSLDITTAFKASECPHIFINNSLYSSSIPKEYALSQIPRHQCACLKLRRWWICNFAQDFQVNPHLRSRRLRTRRGSNQGRNVILLALCSAVESCLEPTSNTRSTFH